jgi:aerobic-type carbon monoxide dehydrogenase small subunit (CoxS/CutS family)
MTRITVTVDGAEATPTTSSRAPCSSTTCARPSATGTVVGCDTSNCGACTVHLDGRSVKSCNVLAVQVDGHEVTTIEGWPPRPDCTPCSRPSTSCHALQCGLLHTGNDHAGHRRAQQPRTRPRSRSARASRATCAGAPATTTSSRPSLPRQGARRGAVSSSKVEVTEMTAADERPAETRRSARPAAQGGPAPHHRPHQVDRQHRAARHAPPGHGPQPLRPRPDDPSIDTEAAKGADRASSPCSPPPTSRTAWAPAPTPGRSRPTRSGPTTCRWSTGSPSPARSSPSSSPGRPRRPVTPPNSSTSTTTSCRPCSTLKEALKDEVLAHPDKGTNKSRLLAARLRRGRHRW